MADVDLKVVDPEASHLENTNSGQILQLDPNAPSNWPKWKKNAQIIMVAFHSMVSTFMAAGIVPAYDTMAETYGVTVTQASYLTSIQILVLGIFPFVWRPLASTYGRYHISLLSVGGSMIVNIGAAWCTSYGSQMATRIIVAILICPPIGIGSGIVTELCEFEERAQKLGWWTLMTTIGTPAGPFIMGFVTKHIGMEWIFWIFAIMNFAQLVAYLLFGEETLYVPSDGTKDPTTTKDTRNVFIRNLIPRRINPRPLKLIEFIDPLFMARLPRVMIPSFALGIAFCYGNIAIVVE
ncbi:hypothetical protein LTS12_029431, partial [Elasticomyces elasticus]